MNQANIKPLVSKLKFDVGRYRKLRNPLGPLGRHQKIQKTLTALLKYERIELFYNRADETRGYVERLISEAARHGPEHEETMEMADYWILEKQLVHKLFKVLVPRYQNYTTAYTNLHMIPRNYPGSGFRRAILELRGNVYPSLDQRNPHDRNLLHNVLLDAAKREFRQEKYNEMAEKLGKPQS